jgi:hypothetical protein
VIFFFTFTVFDPFDFDPLLDPSALDAWAAAGHDPNVLSALHAPGEPQQGYQPTEQDMSMLASSGIVLASNVGMEISAGIQADVKSELSLAPAGWPLTSSLAPLPLHGAGSGIMSHAFGDTMVQNPRSGNPSNDTRGPGRWKDAESVLIVTDLSPDTAPVEGGVKLLVTGNWTPALLGDDASRWRFVCVFGSAGVEAQMLQAGVLRCFCPREYTILGVRFPVQTLLHFGSNPRCGLHCISPEL